MKKRNLLSLCLLFITLSPIVLGSCSKINEATELGANLIPTIDNINTFDTTLDVETFNELFDLKNDSIRSIISDEQFLGYIGNDPLFGKTEASLFLQLKPAVYPFTFPFQKTGSSLVRLDSVVLLTAYVETYGDSSALQAVQVYEVAQIDTFKSGNNYLISTNNFPNGTNAISAVKMFAPQDLNDSMTLLTKDKVANQLRIPLSASFGTRLFNYTSTTAYATDSAFNTNFKGFEIRPVNKTGNAVIGIDLLNTNNTKLAFYYRYNNGTATIDTVEYFSFTATSASANYIKRDRIGSQLQTYIGGTAPDNLVFLQNTPGSYARIRLPGLSTVNNRLVHRAELIMEQVWDNSDQLFAPPFYLFLDAYDAARQVYRTIPFDLNIGTNSVYNAASFGMIGRKTKDAAGKEITIWKFDLSRYIQHVLNGTTPNYELRVSAPFFLKDIYSTGAAGISTEVAQTLPVINPASTKGRVRIGGGNHASQKMKLRIIYSKI